MKLTQKYLTGLDYLMEVTRFLQECRNEDPGFGLNEAADLQWWWREDNCSTPERQIFWQDERGKTAAVMVLYKDESQWHLDFFRRPLTSQQTIDFLLPEIIEIAATLNDRASFSVREDDTVIIQFLQKNGWFETNDRIVQTILKHPNEHSEHLPNGFTLTPRSEDQTRPHPMTLKGRNPSDLEDRLAECSLYRSDLDFSILDSSGRVAAYALFWFDPVTRVGLLEPMRTEEEFQGKGLGTWLVHEGIKELESRGASVIKVSYREKNEAAKRLYHKCGFRDVFRKLEYQREAANKAEHSTPRGCRLSP